VGSQQLLRRINRSLKFGDRKQMPQFSLIIATLGRTDELRKMLQSAAAQAPVEFEVIIVDQNNDNRVGEILSELALPIALNHVRLTKKSLSLARNVGLQHASGTFVAFPDDDCWYPFGLLSKVAQWFETHPKYEILATGAVDEDGLPSGNRWFQNSCDIRPINALRTTFSNSLFLRRAALPEGIRFDENLSASEETDYILRLLKIGLRGRFDRSFSVGHPRRDMLSGTVSKERARKYGQGMGQFVRHHSLTTLWLALLGYDLARGGAVLFRGKFADAGFCFAHARGLFQGFLATR
jgi:glycosyltransferase involved in cell wall biosynthesis